MFCPKCGSRNPDSSKQCSACGCDLPDYSVDNTGSAAIGFSVFFAVLFTILAIVSKVVADDSSAAKSSLYILGQYVGKSSWRDIYNTAFGFCLFIAVFSFFMIFVAISKKGEAEERNVQLNQKTCPYCKEKISIDSTVCERCGSKLIAKPDFWICQKCGRKNHIYVGTCACGEGRP